MSEWISTKDKLPPVEQMVLVWHWGYDIGYVDEDPDNLELRWNFEEYDLYGDEMEQVKAWMPLPEPPKENDDEDGQH